MSKHPYILSATDIAAHAGTDKVHFLNDRAVRNNKSLGDMTGLTGLGFHLIEVAPGMETTEYHLHYFEDECVYVLSGSATATIGEVDFAIGAGDFLGFPKGGEAHTIVNTGTQPLICLVAGQRLAHDVGDYPRKGKRIYRNEGQPWDLVDLDQIETVGGNAGKK